MCVCIYIYMCVCMYSISCLYVEQQLFFFRSSESYLLWGVMLNFQWPVWESESDNTKFNTPVSHSHLRPCNTNESHDTGERKWLIGPNLDISLRGLLTFVASGLNINDCVLSYFEGAATLYCYTSCTLTTLHCYTSCTLTTLHISKVSFLQCCHMKIYNTIFRTMWAVYSLLWDTVCMYLCILIKLRFLIQKSVFYSQRLHWKIHQKQ